jgi:hypothetical protein
VTAEEDDDGRWPGPCGGGKMEGMRALFITAEVKRRQLNPPIA